MLTPKHNHSFVVFLVLVAAGYSLHNFSSRNSSATLPIVICFTFFLMVVTQNAVSFITNPASAIKPDLTVVCYVMLVVMIALSLMWYLRKPELSVDTDRLIQVLTVLVVAELSANRHLRPSERMLWQFICHP